jgi:hypothetical protein
MLYEPIDTKQVYDRVRRIERREAERRQTAMQVELDRRHADRRVSSAGGYSILVDVPTVSERVTLDSLVGKILDGMADDHASRFTSGRVI